MSPLSRRSVSVTGQLSCWFYFDEKGNLSAGSGAIFFEKRPHKLMDSVLVTPIVRK